MTEFHIDAGTRYAEVQGRVVLLNFKSEGYYVLDPVASSMWRQLALRRPSNEILRTLLGQYAVDAARLERDWDRFVNDCLQAGFLTASPPPPPLAGARCREPAPVRGFLTLRAWCSLFRASRWLAKRGFSGAYWGFAGLPRPVAPAADAQALLGRAVAAFSRAENVFHLRRAPQDCLPRSLALFGFLRRLGLGVEHVIGVQMFPFLAHAWVEHRGRVVHEDPANPQRFTTIARISA